MANNFNVNVIAIDKFTATFRKLNNSASKAVRPLTMASRSLGALAQETHLTKTLSGINRIAQASAVMGKTLGVALGPLESLLTVGAAGGIIGGIGAAGVAATALGVRVGNAGFEVAKTSSLLGLNDKALQRWRGAAKLAGGSADTMTETLFALRDTMQNSYWGRDPAALAMFNKLGFTFKKNANGALDIEDGLIQISRAMERLQDPAQRNILAQMLHLPPDSIWVLQQGPQALEQFADQAERLGMMVQPSTEFKKALEELKGSIEGVANAWGTKMVPIVIDGMKGLTHGFNTGGFWGGVGNAMSGLGAGLGSGALYQGGRFLSGLGSPTDLGPTSRIVSGAIGGPLHSGTLTKEDLARRGAALAGGSSSDSALRAAIDAPYGPTGGASYDLTGGNIRELRDEIARAPDDHTGRKQALQQELNRIEVQINLGNAPPGTTAAARSSNGTPVDARVQYAMPTGISP